MNDHVDREAIEHLAYQLWEERGRPIGSPEVDWFRAEQEPHLVSSTANLPFSDLTLEPEQDEVPVERSALAKNA